MYVHILIEIIGHSQVARSESQKETHRLEEAKTISSYTLKTAFLHHITNIRHSNISSTLLEDAMNILHVIAHHKQSDLSNPDSDDQTELTSLFMKGDPVYNESKIDTIKIEGRRLAHAMTNKVESIARFYKNTCSLILMLPMIVMPVEYEEEGHTRRTTVIHIWNSSTIFILLAVATGAGHMSYYFKKKGYKWPAIVLAVILLCIIKIMFPDSKFTITEGASAAVATVYLFLLTILIGIRYQIIVLYRDFWLWMSIVASIVDMDMGRTLAEWGLVSGITTDIFHNLTGSKTDRKTQILAVYFVMVILPLLGYYTSYIPWSACILLMLRVVYIAASHVSFTFIKTGATLVVILAVVLCILMHDPVHSLPAELNQIAVTLDVVPAWMIFILLLVWAQLTMKDWFNNTRNKSTGSSITDRPGTQTAVAAGVALLEVAFTVYNINVIDVKQLLVTSACGVLWLLLQRCFTTHHNFYRNRHRRHRLS